ncbi:MAG: N-acetylmuramoyl-L-alanine amidase [Verrucomicrobiota bacterium]
MRTTRLILILLFACAASVVAGDWTLVKYDGRDHVTLNNVSQFYGLGSVTRVHNDLTIGTYGRSLRGAVGSNELYINNLKFILSYPIADHNGEPIVSRMDLTKVIEPVLRPSRIKGAEKVDTIVLDPGHGGHDNGATSIWGNEKNFALDVALRAKSILEQHGFKVFLTRSADYFVPLEERVRFANRHSNALFIAIHFNSGGPAASGLETYTLAPRGVPSMMADGPRISDLDLCPGNAKDSENMALATATHASLVSHSLLYDRGIKRARFVVIRDITVPGVLVEGGFLSNPSDSRKIATTQYRQNMAFCIAAAAQNYRNAVGSPAPPTLVAGQSVKVRDEAVGVNVTPQPKTDEESAAITPATAN